MADVPRLDPQRKEYVVKVRSPWTIFLLPAAALAYFAYVLLVAIEVAPAFRVPLSQWVYGGLALFVIVLFWTWLLGVRRSPKPPKAKKEKKVKVKAAPAPAQPAPEAVAAPEEDAVQVPVRMPARAEEIVYSGETYKGRRVLEVSAPPKSVNRGAVYTKTYVAVNDELVVRIEDLVETPNQQN